MLSDDEVYNLSDTFQLEELIMWPDLEEGAKHFKERTYRWWGQYFGHPVHETKGYCLSCGRGGSCIWQVFTEGVSMATIQALGRTDRLMGLPGEECERVGKDEPHPQHVHNTRDEEWAICDGRPSFIYWTQPWDKGLEIHILNSAMDREIGVTQTHVDHPEDTVEGMVADYLALTLHCRPDAFDASEITPFWLTTLGVTHPRDLTTPEETT